MPSLKSKAIKAALENKWKHAIKWNKQILAENSDDIDALNRLAFAYAQSGNIKEARKFCRQVLAIDKFNVIANKNLKKFLKRSDGVPSASINVRVSPDLFLQEPGKTKIIMLINIAPSQVLANLRPGQEMMLIAKRFIIEVRDQNKNYIGALPDDLSFLLQKLMQKGNRYKTFIKDVNRNSVTIFVKEIRRGRGNKNQPIF